MHIGLKDVFYCRKRREIEMDGQASEALRRITESKRMEVPFFQRPYAWNEDDFEALIESFQDADGIRRFQCEHGKYQQE